METSVKGWVGKLVDYVKVDVSKFLQNFHPRDLRYVTWTTGKWDCKLREFRDGNTYLKVIHT